MLLRSTVTDVRSDDTSFSKRYLVEFRGLYPSMRMMELTDALLYYSSLKQSSVSISYCEYLQFLFSHHSLLSNL